MRLSSRITIAVLAAVTLAAPASAVADGPCSAPGGRPWCDRSQSAEKRAALLVAAMTEGEKISLLAGAPAGVHTGATAAVPRLGVPQSFNTDGPVGVRQGSATAMPTPIALASTFDPALAYAYGRTLGNEARAKGNDGLLGPTVNILRVPYNGRTFEGFGEDPFLAARTTVGWIEGAQSQGVYATVKHFAANNQEGKDVTGLLGLPSLPIGLGLLNTRYLQDSIVDERTLREIYLPQFEAAVREAKALTVMCSYNRVNGPWACYSKPLLTDVLRTGWGFRGTVMSDWVFATHPDDTVPALNNGLDLEMPSPNAYEAGNVARALAAGRVSRATLDQRVRNIFYPLFKIGFFERPTAAPNDALIDRAAHRAAARKVEENAITLLKNDRALPLDPAKVRSIAVIGRDADTFVTGGGSGNVKPFAPTTVLAGLRGRAARAGIRVDYADGGDPAAAAAAARAADVAVVVVGDYQTEGADKSCLTLECPPKNGDQDGLVRAVAGAQPSTVVVLQTGGPVLTPWLGSVRGLLEAWYPGEAGGDAVARVLFGDVDPGGRLAATFPRSEDQLQVAGEPDRYPGNVLNGQVQYSEGVMTGYRWFDQYQLDPQFPFGFGLSYTSWKYGVPTIRPAADGTIAATVTLTVQNSGRRAGVETPQMYLTKPSPAASVPQPPMALEGFAKVRLAPGATQAVSIPISERSLSYWDVGSHRWRVAKGCYGVTIGRSSRSPVRRATIAVGGASCPDAVAALPGPVTPPASATCERRSAVRIRLRGDRRLRGAVVKGVTVTVNGKRVATLHGRRTVVRVPVRRRHRRVARVRIAVRTGSGRTVVLRRRYRLCATGTPVAAR